MELFELTRALIDIPSLSGDEEAVGLFLLEELKGRGFKTERQVVDDKRANVIAMHDKTPNIFLSTHMDTVPPFIPFSEDDKYIYGRGACDAKGIIAAQILAAQSLGKAGINVGLLFTVDEEVSSLGARAANDHPSAKSCEFLINGEPTDNILAVGSKGSLRIRLTSRGRAAHSAYPEHGKSAIEPLLDVLQDIRKYRWPSDVFFGDTTCNIGVIQGGTRSNVIPAEAHADIHFRLVSDSESILEQLNQIVGERTEVEILSGSEAVKMLSVPGFEQTIVRFTTDIPYLKNWGTPLLLGPGSILVAHTDEERVSRSELVRSVGLYEQLVRKLVNR